ncbi:MAG TPA: hypothetical protein VL651_13110 [Bacteroidia bacterium]|nr:hypothetical protein [Bacteroidia bacterium]
MIGFTCLPSCDNSAATTPPSKDATTLALEHYLADNYGDSIGDEKCFYVLVSKKATTERIAMKMKFLKDIFSASPKTMISIIISSAVPLQDSLQFATTKTDWDGAVDKLSIVNSSVTVIRTANGKIEAKDDVMDQDKKYWEDFIRQ